MKIFGIYADYSNSSRNGMGIYFAGNGCCHHFSAGTGAASFH